MNQEQKWITTGNLIGGLFTFLLCTTGLALAGVFIAKLAANHSQVAPTDFLLLALGLTILVIGYKCNFEKFIFTSGGLQRINILFCRLGLVLSGLIIAIKLFAGKTSSYTKSLEEGGIVEWSSFILLLSSAYILFWCANQIHTRISKAVYYALAAFSFVIGMEEMSWGQILFGWETPSSLSIINAQKETNLHNLSFIHGQADLLYGCILLAIIILSVSRDKLAGSMRWESCAELVRLLAPPKQLLVFFIPACILILCLYLDLHEHTNGFIFKGEEEIAEMFGAFGLLGYSTSKASQFANSSRDSSLNF